MYTAIKNKGAYCNDKEIHVNKLKYGDVGCSLDYCFWLNAKYDTLKMVDGMRSDVRVCQIESVAHACMLIARGTIYTELFPGTIHCHCDMAASKIIVEEAGGKVTSFKGEEQRYDKDIDGIIASNGIIHEELLKRVEKLY